MKLWLLTVVLSSAIYGQSTPWPGFAFYHEFYGPNAYADPQVAQNFNQGLMNGLTFSPPVDPAVALAAKPFNAGLMLRLPGATQPAGISPTAIEEQHQSLISIASASTPGAVLWNLLPEWDQTGGSWVSQGRPRYQRLSRAAAHAAFLQFYKSNYPSVFGGYMKTPLDQRDYLLTAVTDYSPNVFDAYELGVEVQLLERGIDELGDLSTGIAYLRGAANQYNKIWGIDLSNWRTGTNMASTYNSEGILLGGWSADYIRRHYYYSFLAGAKLIQNEATTYRYSDGSLNPLGTATQEFANFALRRHPDLGQPVITTAVLVNPDSGFDPKHGLYNLNDAVWYQDSAYAAADTMSNQFFRLACPNHWQHGLAPGAPFANADGVPNVTQFKNFLAAGQDPRPYEIMPNTRWGDQLDVITTRAGADALSKYKLIILLGDVKLDARLRSDLSDWVNHGGTLVINSTQVTAADQNLLGLTIVDFNWPRTSSFFRWLPDDAGRVEAPFQYSLVQPTTANVWAVNEKNDPMLTSNSIGAGQVIFTAAAYLEPTAHNDMLAMGVQLFDYLFQQVSPVQITGPSVAYIVNTAPGKLVIGLFNHSGTDWNGQVQTTLPVDPDQVKEYVSDQSVQFVSNSGSVSIQAQVPAYDLKVIAIEYTLPPPQVLPK